MEQTSWYRRHISEHEGGSSSNVPDQEFKSHHEMQDNLVIYRFRAAHGVNRCSESLQCPFLLLLLHLHLNLPLTKKSGWAAELGPSPCRSESICTGPVSCKDPVAGPAPGRRTREYGPQTNHWHGPPAGLLGLAKQSGGGFPPPCGPASQSPYEPHTQARAAINSDESTAA